MTETSGHLPECLNDDDTYGLRGLCICDELRACEQRVLDAAREAVDRLASEMANWSSAETVAATGAVPDLTADQWMWAQRGVWRALAAIDVLREEQK